MEKPSFLVLFALSAAIALILAIGYGLRKNRAPNRVYVNGIAWRGKEVINEKRCGSCHTIPGINGARGVVGPPLFFLGRRTMIAGLLPNTPENLARWIQSPQSVNPQTAMPTLGLSQEQARDVAAYLFTLR
ncbi:MAG TPA: c-type cytochrome [Candidatus Acidoferrales bacterium]|nr:c-type cytochrome [Candidatus Acidoferrales bacterium]